MKEYEIKLSDLQRILVGEVPFHFYLEVIFRVVVIYLILMVSMRLMGKRMSSQLSRNEMAAVASLAAAIGIPLMNPDRGLLPAVVIAVVIITYQVAIARRAARDKRFESMTQGAYNMLVKDGVLNIDAMILTRISRDRVFAQLRSESIPHLGLVRRLYFEAGGGFSLLKAADPKPGLSIIPDRDKHLFAGLNVPVAGEVCSNCGNPRQSGKGPAEVCNVCHSHHWEAAVVIRY